MDRRTTSFGYWLRRRRKALDLTQEALAQAASCSRFAIRKIEADERRPSRRLAERLADRLAIPAGERAAFIEAARSLRAVDGLDLVAHPLAEADDALSAAPAAKDESPPTDAAGLVGRSNELGQMIGLLARVAGGEGHVALVEGEAGIGKSRLLQEIVRYASARSIRVLAARCYEIERSMPYQPIVELLAQAVDLCSDAMLRKLAPIALAELATIAPAIGERCPDLPALAAHYAEARQARLFRAIVQLLDVLAEARQLLIAVDDVHWADETSRQFLHYLARQAGMRPLLLLLAYRAEEVDAEAALSGFMQNVRGEPHARHMPLARLSRTDVEALVAERAAEIAARAGVAQRLYRESEGNPFFLLSILHSLEESGASATLQTGVDGARADQERTLPMPDALRASVRARLDRLSRAPRNVLEIAAVLGRRFDFDLLREVSSAPPEALLDQVEELLRRGLLREEADGRHYDFSHDKIREVSYLETAAARRVLVHRRVVEVLQHRPDAERHEHTARLAEHCERAQLWVDAVRYLTEAARQSQALFALREALRWLDRAIAIAAAHPDVIDADARAALIEQRGRARADAGQAAGAVADFEAVIDIARARSDGARVRQLLIELGMAQRRADAYERAQRCLDEALRAARATQDESQVADTLYHLGTVAWSDGRNAEATRFHQEAVDICDRLRLADRVAVQAFHGRGEAHFASAEPHAAIACYTRSIEYARGIGDKSYEAENIMMIGWASTGIMGIGDYRLALESFEAALAIVQAADLQWHWGPTVLGRDHVRACIGHYPEAWLGMRESLQQLEELSLPRYTIMAHELLGHLLLDVDANVQAAETLERGLAIARAARVSFWQSRLQAAAAIARLRADAADPRAQIEDALRRSRDAQERYLETRCLEALAEAAFARGELAHCGDAAASLLAIAQAGDMREQTAIALRWRGEAALAAGDLDAARQALEPAEDIVQRVGRPRLSLDLHRALARLAKKRRRHADVRRHEGAADAIELKIAAARETIER